MSARQRKGQSSPKRSMQDVANKLEWEGGICGLVGYLGGDLDSTDDELNKLWEEVAAGIEELRQLLDIKLEGTET